MSQPQPQPQRHPCESASHAVHRCHHAHGSRGEDCVREELLEKRCIAELLCRREAQRFYYEPLFAAAARGGGEGGGVGFGGATCSALVEKFAFPENELLLPEYVGRDERKECRRIVHGLAACLARRTGGVGGKSPFVPRELY